MGRAVGRVICAIGLVPLEGIAAGLAVGETILAVNRALTAWLKRNFALFLAIGANGLVEHTAILPAIEAGIRLGTLAGLRVVLGLRLAGPFVMLRRRPYRCLGQHQIHFFLETLQPFRNLQHHGHKFRQIGLRLPGSLGGTSGCFHGFYG